MRSTTETLIAAMRVLARDIQSDDGVANAAIAEAADRLEECSARIAELEARAAQFQLIGFTTPSYVEEWLATRDPAHLLLMAYHGNHRVAVFTLKDGAELAKRGESPQFEGTMVEPQVGDVIRRPDVPPLPVAVEAQQRAGVPEGSAAVMQRVMADAPMGQNRFGLDARYFHEKLSLILRDIESFTPAEMHNALARLADTAAPAPKAQTDDAWDREAERLTFDAFGPGSINPNATSMSDLFNNCEAPQQQAPQPGRLEADELTTAMVAIRQYAWDFAQHVQYNTPETQTTAEASLARVRAELAEEAVPSDEVLVTRVMLYGSRCRDCADNGPVCGMTGMPCDPDERYQAFRHVISALRYSGTLTAAGGREELEALRRDAERYRWLRVQENFPCDEGSSDAPSFWDQLCELEYDEFDQWIDQTMVASQPAQEGSSNG